MMSYHLLPGKPSNALVTSGKLINSTSFFDGRRGFLVWIICRTNSLGLSSEGSLNLLRVPALILIAIPKMVPILYAPLVVKFHAYTT